MRLFISLFMVLLSVQLSGQDFHFSQIKNSKSNINPALSGEIKGDFLAVFQRRSQWASISEPFNTVCLSLYIKNLYKDYSLGFNFINDVAGLANFQTNGINISPSLKILKMDKHNLTIGFGLAAFQRSYDLNSLTFYEDEQFVNQNNSFFDISLGTTYKHIITKNSILELGLSAFHINNPNQSFSNTYEDNTPTKYVSFLELNHEYSKLVLTPSIFYSHQLNQRELVFGCSFLDEINYANREYIYSLGLYYRNKDALIPQVSISIENIDLFVSYDINISELNKASNYYGAIEFSVLYNWNRKKSSTKNKFICPRYL